jgi:hypothetical protein
MEDESRPALVDMRGVAVAEGPVFSNSVCLRVRCDEKAIALLPGQRARRPLQLMSPQYLRSSLATQNGKIHPSRQGFSDPSKATLGLLRDHPSLRNHPGTHQVRSADLLERRHFTL